METISIAVIYGGQGEGQSVPVLLRRFHAEATSKERALQIRPLIRVSESAFCSLNERGDKERHRQIEVAARKLLQEKASRSLLLIIFDCEDGCPATLGPAIKAKCAAIRPDLPLEVILAYREFETWFIAAAQSLAGYRGFPEDFEPLSDPESRRGAKEWLNQSRSQGYDPVRDQASLVSRFNFD